MLKQQVQMLERAQEIVQRRRLILQPVTVDGKSVYPLVATHMLQGIMKEADLPAKYRVIGWCNDGKCWVWTVNCIFMPDKSKHRSFTDLREAASMEVDDWFPILIKLMTDDMYQQYTNLKVILDWTIPQLMEWGLIKGSVTAAVSP
jgi:hypothetical protein